DMSRFLIRIPNLGGIMPSPGQSLSIILEEPLRQRLPIHRRFSPIFEDNTQTLLTLELVLIRSQIIFAHLCNEQHDTVEDEELSLGNRVQTLERNKAELVRDKLSMFGLEKVFKPFKVSR